MKICPEHIAQLSEALKKAGLDGAQKARLGSRHTPWSAAEWEIRNRGYQALGKRVLTDDICPLCEMSEDSESHVQRKCIADTVKNVAAKHGRSLK
jgi:hypothetical protein